MSAPVRLPVREHLRPKPQRNFIPPEKLAEMPPELARELTTVAVIEQVDRSTHPLGWGYDLTRFIDLHEAEAFGWDGQA